MIARPLVSCIVPVYNGSRFLGEAIDSILAQTYENLEVIVVDDGSTDSTPRVAGRYGERLTYVRQDNAGPAVARNRGMAEAGGELFAFLDCDDRWAPAKTEIQVERLAAAPELDVSLTRIQNVWEDEVDAERRLFLDRRRSRPLPGYSPTTLLARASVFDVVGPFDGDLGHAHTTDWFVRAREAGIVIEVVPDVLAYRRLHASNLSRSKARESLDEHFDVIQSVLDQKRARDPRPTDPPIDTREASRSGRAPASSRDRTAG